MLSQTCCLMAHSFVPSKLAAITIVLVLSNILFMHGE